MPRGLNKTEPIPIVGGAIKDMEVIDGRLADDRGAKPCPFEHIIHDTTTFTTQQDGARRRTARSPERPLVFISYHPVEAWTQWICRWSQSWRRGVVACSVLMRFCDDTGRS
eukprot:scaffold111753_cov29-Attheya_sp.AAC.1